MSDLGNMEVFAENLKHYMKINHKNRRDLERDLKFTYSTLSNWINAERYPRIDKIEKLSSYFNIEKSDLIEKKEKNSLHLIIGENLRLARQNARLTVEQIAKQLDLPSYQIIQFEEADRIISVELLCKLAKLLNVKMDDLTSSSAIYETKSNNTNKTDLERQIKMWDSEIGTGVLTNYEVEKMIEYAKFLISQRGV